MEDAAVEVVVQRGQGLFDDQAKTGKAAIGAALFDGGGKAADGAMLAVGLHNIDISLPPNSWTGNVTLASSDGKKYALPMEPGNGNRHP